MGAASGGEAAGNRGGDAGPRSQGRGPKFAQPALVSVEGGADSGRLATQGQLNHRGFWSGR